MAGEVYVKTQEQFEKAKEISLEIMPILQDKSGGEFLITLQALDLMQDIVIKQAMDMKAELDHKRSTIPKLAKLQVVK